jgi:SAM-dependent methyltransferase
VDPSPQMLEQAAARAPGVELVVGALPALDLGPRRFDAVVSLFSVIGYLVEDGELAAGVAAMAGHLAPGGCLLVEGWVETEFWVASSFGAEATSTPEVAVSRVIRTSREGDVTALHMRYVAATAEGMRTIDEHHRLRLADPAEHEAAFVAAGLTFERLPHLLHDGRSVYVGVRT